MYKRLNLLNITTPSKQLHTKPRPTNTNANKLNQEKASQMIKTPIRIKETCIEDFRSNPRSNFQLSQRKHYPLSDSSNYLNTFIYSFE